MVILAVDYGDARTGVAACDRMQLLASPVCVIKERSGAAVVEKLIPIISERKAELILVGLPLNMDDSEGERAEKCREFAALLEEKSGVKTVMVDERLTTVEAHEQLSAVNKRGKKRKAIVDAVSAVVILEDYLSTL